MNVAHSANEPSASSPAALAATLGGEAPSLFEADVRLIVRKPGSPGHSAALGRGVVQLCRLVESLGSLNKAAAQMGMAYSKAWKTLKHVEEEFGFKLLQRNGAHGSVLTAQGRALLDAYERTQAALEASAGQEFARALSEATALEALKQQSEEKA